MQLVIDDYGTFIGKEGERFKIERKDGKDEFASDDVDQIIVARASSISSDAVKLAMEKNIDVVYLDHFGMPLARIYPCRLGGTTLTRRRQAEATVSEKAAPLIITLVEAKIRNQIYLLKSLEKTREGVDFSAECATMEQAAAQLAGLHEPLPELKERVMGFEGSCSALYFSCLSRILPFTERQHEAKDPFNAMLNYGYGILYSEVEKACILAGLDPYLGFLHSDRYGKPSLVLDVIENFRQPIVDRAIITLFVQKQVVETDTERSGNTLQLTKQGKCKVVDAVLGRLHTRIEYGHQHLTFQQILLDQCRSIARYLREDGYVHKPFVHRW